MKKQRYTGEPKPIEEWTTTEWEAAYNVLNEKFEKLKNKMRKAMNAISTAQQWLSEAVI